jgi:hypothetical protein
MEFSQIIEMYLTESVSYRSPLQTTMPHLLLVQSARIPTAAALF